MPDRQSDSSSDTRNTASPPLKRARRVSPNGNASESTTMPIPPLSVSILGVEPLDEFIREVADFIHHTIHTRPGPDVEGTRVEVEAKVGVLKERVGSRRLMLPVRVETILQSEGMDLRFESNMSPMQHKHYNTLLNTLKSASPQSQQGSLLTYNHQYLVDSFYSTDNPRDRDKIRVTREEKTGVVLECVRKIRLGNLDIYSPKRGADWRISVNLEIPVSHPIGTPTHIRRKDRMSYSHEEFIIDLTQVTSTVSANSPPEISHELELEIARPALLLALAAKRGDDSVPEQERYAFDDLIHAFVNNARILVRNAGD